MTIDQKGITNIPANNRLLLKVQLVDVIDNLYTLALTAIHGLHNPSVSFGFSLLKLHEMGYKVAHFFW